MEDPAESDFYGTAYTREMIELIDGTTLTKRLYSRQLCGQYNPEKIQAFKDLVTSTNDRLIVFYNFDAELELLKKLAASLNRPVSGGKCIRTGTGNCRMRVPFDLCTAGGLSCDR